MVFDFPDFTARNPWQLKSIGPTGKGIIRSNMWPPAVPPAVLHISWEDVFIKDHNGDEAEKKVRDILEDIDKMLSVTRLYWTVHNLTSHRLINKDAEKSLRAGLAKRAHKIILMSERHIHPLALDPYRNKIEIIPHYIEPNPFLSIREEASVKNAYRFYKYGDARDDIDRQVIEDIISNRNIEVFVSDKRLHESISEGRIIVTRRFTSLEANLYAAASNFSIFNRKPQLNSGVMNFYLGSQLAVFHDVDSVKYMDLPSSYADLVLDNVSWTDVQENLHKIKSHSSRNKELGEYINFRLPEKTRARYWSAFKL